MTYEIKGGKTKDIYEILQGYARTLLAQHQCETEEVIVRARALTPEEAIGNPEDKDYPIVTGREKMIEAQFRSSRGQAFTDTPGDYTARAIDIASMELGNNFRRAVFISSLNALMRDRGLVDRTVHCRDDEPKECSRRLTEYIKNKYGRPRIAVAGLQPRMVEALSQVFEIRVTDLDEANIGSERFGVTIQGPTSTRENLDWCDIALVTGSTIVNGSIRDFLISKPVIFYGVTIAGAAKALGLENFCYCGK